LTWRRQVTASEQTCILALHRQVTEGDASASVDDLTCRSAAAARNLDVRRRPFEHRFSTTAFSPLMLTCDLTSYFDH
jgi:hypothetical protein